LAIARSEKDEALLRQIQEFKALDEQHRRKLTKYKLESNQKFEKIKDKVIEIKQKQEETKQERIKPQPIIPQVEELKPVSDQMDINTDKIRALKSKKFAKKEIKQEELW